jgi:hypothetical protein
MVPSMLLTGTLLINHTSQVTGIDGRLAFQIDPSLTRYKGVFGRHP